MPPQTHFWWNFCFKISLCVWDITIFFFAILKLYFCYIHRANNLILAISFGFKLNSDLKWLEKVLKSPWISYWIFMGYVWCTKWQWALSCITKNTTMYCHYETMNVGNSLGILNITHFYKGQELWFKLRKLNLYIHIPLTPRGLINCRCSI